PSQLAGWPVVLSLSSGHPRGSRPARDNAAHLRPPAPVSDALQTRPPQALLAAAVPIACAPRPPSLRRCRSAHCRLPISPRRFRPVLPRSPPLLSGSPLPPERSVSPVVPSGADSG